MKLRSISQEEARAHFDYDPETGIFRHAIYTGGMVKGSIAGTIDKYGYIVLAIKERKYFAHRVAWVLMTGSQCPPMIDHINGDSLDNRWSNLRAADHALNQQNQRRPRPGNKTGFLGVFPSGKRFGARIQAKDKYHFLGTFDTPELAHAAYVKAKRVLHPGGTL